MCIFKTEVKVKKKNTFLFQEKLKVYSNYFLPYLKYAKRQPMLPCKLFLIDLEKVTSSLDDTVT